ncbi:MAG: single-stranded-DNA-specific exonuclease RecJ [Caldithrix sp.]|nr:single-stranded-DNA-specific exonuclease RecJ [Caldithrix sp.]
MIYQWVLPRHVEKNLLLEITEKFNFHPIIGQILYNRQIDTPEKIERYFQSSLSDLYDPFLFNQMNDAVERIIKALREGEHILIYGDYDVDGVTSVSILYDGLFRLGGKVSFFIPDRFKEGYGVTIDGIKAASKRAISLIITVDCGITAVKEVASAREFGIDVIVCDHHEASDTLPDAHAIINPKTPHSGYPFTELAGCGVTFKVLQALAIRVGYSAKFAYRYLDLVAIGTAADIVKLVDENRILVKHGLDKINRNPRPGIFALLESCNVLNRSVTVSMIVFVLAPRLNAVGRISNAKKAVHLLTTASYQQGRNIARILEKENKQRKSIDELTLEDAKQYIEDHLDISKKRILVLAKEDWHNGVIGIVASRLMELYNRPVILISIQDGIGKGSARSLPGFDIYAALHQTENLLDSYGGHRYAAGITIRKEKIAEFDRNINALAEKELKAVEMIPKLSIDAEIKLDRLDIKFINDLKKMAPYGPENMRPVLLSSGLGTSGGVSVVGNNHLKTKFKQNGVVIDAIGYKMGKYLYKFKQPYTHLSCAYVLEENFWQGQKTLQMRIKDFEVY